MTDLAFIFPGQGAQSVGMGKDLADAFPTARAVFEEVDEALAENLSHLIWNGPEDQLTLTANTQPALMAVSVAVARVLETDFDTPITAARFVAGHSLGEYSALAAAGSLTLADTARLLRRRGDAMQAAVAPGDGAMAALLGASQDDAEGACEAGRAAGGICDIANDNAPGQIVLSGDKAAIEAAVEYAKVAGVKKAVMLSVSAPFHCQLMAPAARAMEDGLAETTMTAPVTPLVANVTARETTDPDTLRRQLVEQVTGRVRWRESVEWMAEQGITQMAELGAGKVLTVMNRRTVKGLTGIPLNTPADLEAFAASLSEGTANV